MRQVQQILGAYHEAMHAGKKVALATVVHVEGSSYGRPGSRMLVTDSGEMTGAISGGCLEGDALRKALLAINQQQTKLVTYDTRDEEEASIGAQLGCSGIIQVLFEPIQQQLPLHPILLLQKAVAIRQSAVLVTFFSYSNQLQKQPGTCLLREANGNVSGSIPFAAIEQDVMQDMEEVWNCRQSAFKEYEVEDTSFMAFIEWIPPTVSLVVVGAGNDAIPLMEIGNTLGWDVRIVDGRPTYAKPDRFTSACQVLVSKPEKALAQIPIDDHTVFVLLTHNYQYDLAMLKSLLPLHIPYIGVLGPKKKLERMLQEVEDSGIEITPKMLDKIYGPTGLEIGAETAEEIALSIVAEIKAVLSNKRGGMLRYKQEAIHAPASTKALIIKE